MNKPLLRAEHELIAKWVSPNSRVLDLGCGDGAFLAALAEEKGVTGYGIEIDPGNIAACLSRGVNVLQSNLNDGLNDFDNQSFDYVIMTQTVQAMRYPVRLIDEILRVGSEGIITFPNMGHWKCRVQILRGNMPVTRHLPDNWYDTPNIHMCTVKDFENLCLSRSIVVAQRAAVDTDHKSMIGMQVFPNLLAEIAVYRLRSRAHLSSRDSASAA